jgi:hypothetical protein
MASFESPVKQKPAARKGRKFFTLDEARRALPLVKRIVSDIQAANAERLRIHAEMSTELTRQFAAKQDGLSKAFDRESDRLDALIDELLRIGVEIKDRAHGLVDFPSMHEGREIMLCWESQEQTISYWHEVETGYSGRRPVEELESAER